MPKQTFENLDPKKRQRFTDAFLKEFTERSYDDASISKTLKSLGIAKGSFYQYFESKLDLLLYLKDYCAAVKMQYIAHIERKDYKDFWDYWRALYNAGVKFDNENPKVSNFLYRLKDNLKSPSLAHLYDEMYNQMMKHMSALIKYEVDAGYFRDDLSIRKMAFYLYSISSRLDEHLKVIYNVDVEDNVRNGKPIFMGKSGNEMNKAVEDNIKLLKKAFEK